MDENGLFQLLKTRSLTSGDTVQSTAQWIDAVAFGYLAISFRVIAAASAGTLYVQHAATDSDDDADWFDLASISLASTGKAVADTGGSGYLRFLRWKTSGITGTAVAKIDINAKVST